MLIFGVVETKKRDTPPRQWAKPDPVMEMGIDAVVPGMALGVTVSNVALWRVEVSE